MLFALAVPDVGAWPLAYGAWAVANQGVHVFVNLTTVAGLALLAAVSRART